jgi:hypothetical protein
MSYESIAQFTGSSATGTFNTISFDSIPSTYKHLMVIAKTASYWSSATANTVQLKFNNLSSPTYTSRFYQAVDSGTSASSTDSAAGSIDAITFGRPNSSGDVNYGAYTLYIPNYAATNCKKNFFLQSSSVVGFTSENPSGENRQFTRAGYWDSTNAITNLTFTTDGNPDFASLTEYSLYGLKDS